MKLILLAAAALIATPTLAQTSGSTGTSSPTSNGGQGTAATPAVENSPQNTTSSDTATTSQASPAPADPAAATQTMPMTTGAPTGGTVRFQAPPSVDQAFPAPAPQASYPMCKAGQFDKCMQGSGSTHSRAVRRRR